MRGNSKCIVYHYSKSITKTIQSAVLKYVSKTQMYTYVNISIKKHFASLTLLKVIVSEMAQAVKAVLNPLSHDCSNLHNRLQICVIA